MTISRRRLLQAGLFTVATAAVGASAACGGDDESGSTGGDSKDLSLWYWSGGLSEKVVADVSTQFSDITFKATQVGGSFKDKLVTTITSRQFMPDITGIKGEDIAYFMGQAGQFLDLNELGAGDLKSQYLEWKWKQGSTPDGKLIGFPIDIGPTALFYRADIFKKAGLPSEVADVTAAMSTWDAFFDNGAKLKKALPGTFMVGEAVEVYDMAVGQSTKRYADADKKFIGDQEHIRRAWDLATKAVQLGISFKVASGGQDANAAWNQGTLPAKLGAAWVAGDIKSAAEKTSGNWRIAPMPDGPANQGGSFLSIPKSSGNPKKAFEIITWLLNADNQARGYTDAGLFPAAPAAYKMSALTSPDEFFGGQVTIDVLGAAAEKIPIAYESEYDSVLREPFAAELSNVETKGKDPEAAWNDAVSAAKKAGERVGVS
ncbi:ABC transporter substrate-binding protein [Phytohabitans aurantiacus]|uniref:Sugar ABC transporter substrate-binding protein n=1 Tax=Phytohabitans aurantiacus TaxID=3016789 RepID=A0ABQ5R222_9ACTN|nr:extracellular solute-binding protein [Phytohabitans aurantiacus]GLI00796.1 sugar ABC transporter substrate-binding protein [Phytohabitans aurantiacus]